MKLKHMLREDKKVTLVSLNTTEMKLANDYLTPDEIKIKKPKKKKKIRSRMLKPEDIMDDIPQEAGQRSRNAERGINDDSRIKVESEDPMDIDGIPSIPVLGLDGVKIEEEPDNELELALKKARRLKQMPSEAPKKLPKIEEVIREVKEEPEEDAGLSSIVLNSTAEFCRTLGDIPTYGMAGNRDEEPDILMDFEREKEFKKKKQEEFEDRGGWNDVEMDEKLVETKQIEGTILDAEPDLGAGVAGALRLAVSKGYLEKETSSRPSASRFSHLAAQNYSIDDKAHTAEDEKVGRRERYLGPTMDFKEKDSYKPNIKLEYIDDDGHLLSAKEAFRYLSHKFHGKGPGKNKVEKRMKKNEQEALMKQMSSSDTPLGTLQMLQHKQKETQSAFVVLSGSKALTTPASISKTKMSK
uniref:U4/U6.U5 tri-snRNP-associated protein 1 n=2 Tax=Lygus hesperus TaxID=30085 RepID=A0A0A9WX62_LYGHE